MYIHVHVHLYKHGTNVCTCTCVYAAMLNTLSCGKLLFEYSANVCQTNRKPGGEITGFYSHMSDDGEYVDVCSLQSLSRGEDVTEGVVIIKGAQRNVGQG